jgi:hypothetical protein
MNVDHQRHRRVRAAIGNALAHLSLGMQFRSDELEIVQGPMWSLRRQPHRLLTATSESEALGLLERQPITSWFSTCS